jgi:metallo-beta-lactamase family protein
MSAKLTFCSGAGTVTGSNFLFEFDDAKFLVDCGTHEQERTCGGVDYEPFPYDVREIDALFVTHSHQDHIGRIPRLVRAGFHGPIYSTHATKELAAIMFDDALGIMAEEVKRLGCEPLYERADVERALLLWSGHEYHEPLEMKGAEIEFLDAGHILGSALVKITRGDKCIVFSGDIGNTPEPILRDCEAPSDADYLVMESTYGDRVHEGRSERKEVLRHAVEETRARNGVLLIPSFSLERTQVLLYELNDMIESGKMRPIHIFLDSPLASKINEVLRRYPALFNPEARSRVEKGDDPFSFKGLTVVGSVEESRAVYRKEDPKVIIAGAGMSGGGRVRGHEKELLGSARTTVLFVGYQAPGTLGRRILDGQHSVEIDGQHLQVKARVERLSGYSGHADREQLLDFVESAGEKLQRVYVVMGEPKSSQYLAQRIRDFIGVDAKAPQKMDSAMIDW